MNPDTVKEEFIKIEKSRFKELIRAEEIKEALEAGGVDNWIGYEESLSDLHEQWEDLDD